LNAQNVLIDLKPARSGGTGVRQISVYEDNRLFGLDRVMAGNQIRESIRVPTTFVIPVTRKLTAIAMARTRGVPRPHYPNFITRQDLNRLSSFIVTVVSDMTSAYLNAQTSLQN
jgi:hypothetical protein